MEPRERLDVTSWRKPQHERARNGEMGATTSAEQILHRFNYAEQQRLRYLRQLYERGKLTEFPRQPRD